MKIKESQRKAMGRIDLIDHCRLIDRPPVQSVAYKALNGLIRPLMAS